MLQTENRTLEIPEDVNITLEGKTIKVNGKKGNLLRDFSHAPVTIVIKKRKVVISTHSFRRKESALVGTISSHVVNMINGVTKGFTYKLKIVYSHFPISVKVQGNRILIENFIGERKPREAKIIRDTQVRLKDDDIIVQGIDIEAVSQTASNIEQSTKVKKKDPRKFLDGIYVYKKLMEIVD